jgi:hypothetical protein
MKNWYIRYDKLSFLFKMSLVLLEKQKTYHKKKTIG